MSGSIVERGHLRANLISLFFVDREQKDFKGQLFVYRMKDLGLGANNESTDLVFVEKIESSGAPQ